MFSKILIANRGEIACRVIRTARHMGIRTVAVYSDADEHAQHVTLADEAIRLGTPRPVDSYLRGDVILAAAKKMGAEAIHPGYGFLSENADFARACEKNGIVFIGPTPEAIDAMGSKSAAKALMEAAKVPVVPGYHGSNQDANFLAAEALKVGFPLLIKAVAGGGGKGMRLVESAAEFLAQLESARREAKNAFGNDDVLIERFVRGPHHIEFQVFGDTHGNTVHLFERECSIQRRHQKILEETPSPFLDDAMRKNMGDAAVAAARAIAYQGAGTIEFIVGEDRQFFFMEMNTRLQVEHPITEMTTGCDLVEWQLRVAAGERLPLLQPDITRHGHAIEVRICAENPQNDFLPETGTMARFATPPLSENVRLDTGVVSGDTISVFYDPMIAKLITYGRDRAEATRRMQVALAATDVIGVTTNLHFLQRVVQHAAFDAGITDTAFIATYKAALLAPTFVTVPHLAAACAAIWAAETTQSTSDPWATTHGWRLNAPARRMFEFTNVGTAEKHVCHIESSTQREQEQFFCVGASRQKLAYQQRANGALDITLGEEKFTAHAYLEADVVSVTSIEGRVLLQRVAAIQTAPAEAADEGRLTAAMPGRVVKLLVSAGDTVKKGAPLLIMEAMKMEHTIVSPREGVIERVAFQVGDMVPPDATLFAFVGD